MTLFFAWRKQHTRIARSFPEREVELLLQASNFAWNGISILYTVCPKNGRPKAHEKNRSVPSIFLQDVTLEM
eukprot:scaffold13249_cov98-Cylindrotheca_fusiformis.AAC.1